MTRVFVDVGMSLDGLIAGPNGRPGNPLGDGGTRIHDWVFRLASFSERSGGSGGETGADDDIVRAVFARTGSNVMGRRMFDEGEVGWPEKAPFHTPVFVLTHHAREPWVRPGGTTFFFVTDGFESALEKARAAAGALDVRISGGANVIQQGFKAAAVDELAIHVAPMIMGRGVRLFDHLSTSDLTLQPVEAIDSPAVTHLRYRVVK
jgi:dihydrofolate reductase